MHKHKVNVPTKPVQLTKTTVKNCADITALPHDRKLRDYNNVKFNSYRRFLLTWFCDVTSL